MSIRDVFIIMPFVEQRLLTAEGERVYTTEHFDDVYTILTDAVRAYNRSTIVNRMEQPYGNLVNAIIKRLAQADAVIAVLAGRNPNVFYELGVRHSLRLNTIMLVEQRDEYPFDLSAYFSHQYSVTHESGRRALREFIATRLREIEKQALPDSPVLDVLQQSEFEQLRVLNTWETRRAAMIFEGLIREVRQIYATFTPRITQTMEHEDSATRPEYKRIALTWHMMDGFTKNRPVPRLPRLAYEDAEAVYVAWRRAAQSWNRLIETSDVEPGTLQSMLASTIVGTVAFLHDVVSALEYLITTERAYGIPWGGSLDTAQDLVGEFAILGYTGHLVEERTTYVLERFAAFEEQFLGFPSETSMRPPPSFHHPALADIVAEAHRLDAAATPGATRRSS